VNEFWALSILVVPPIFYFDMSKSPHISPPNVSFSSQIITAFRTPPKPTRSSELALSPSFLIHPGVETPDHPFSFVVFLGMMSRKYF